MKRIHHILAMFLLPALCAFTLASCGKDAEEKKPEHPAVAVLKEFSEAVAQKDIDKIFSYMPPAMQMLKEVAKKEMEKDPAKFAKEFEKMAPQLGAVKSVEEKGENEVLIVCEGKMEGKSVLADVTMKKENGKWVVVSASEHEEKSEE